MRTAIWSIGVLGSVALATGCATAPPKPMTPQGEQAMNAQSQSEASLQKAIDAQKQASQMQDQARKSQQLVTQKEKELADAQSKAAAANQQAQAAQQEAEQLRARANEEAGQAQNEALTAQKNEGAAVPTMPEGAAAPGAPAAAGAAGATQAVGTLTYVKGDDVSVARPEQLPLELHVGAAVPVTLDGKPISLSALPPGADVRVSYEQGPGKLEATRIDATSAGQTGTAPSGAVVPPKPKDGNDEFGQ
ncbi:MAG: hypothetical protein JST54_17600 [Deltaproteobacteria bacterium]|nr:hypothetical protein [Deltaproteobacteria bacterium]